MESIKDSIFRMGPIAQMNLEFVISSGHEYFFLIKSCLIPE